MRLPRVWTPHTVTVSELHGEGALGQIWSTPATVPNVYVEESQEVVRDAAGREVVSSGRVVFNLDDAPLPGSLVTVWAGTKHERAAKIIRVAKYDHPAWPSYAIAYLE